MLRRALNESMRRVASLSSEGNAQVDRRIVVKLLVTFFERGQSQEVLQLMARILVFTGTHSPLQLAFSGFGFKCCIPFSWLKDRKSMPGGNKGARLSLLAVEVIHGAVSDSKQS